MARRFEGGRAIAGKQVPLQFLQVAEGVVQVYAAAAGEEISAAYEDGVLKLTLPKQAKAIPASRRLEIQ